MLEMGLLSEGNTGGAWVKVLKTNTQALFCKAYNLHEFGLSSKSITLNMQATAPPQPNYRPQLYIMPENAGAAQEKKKKKAVQILSWY